MSIKRKIKSRLDAYLNGTCIILTWHKIDKQVNDFTGMSVCPNNFYEQIRHLSHRYNVLTVEEFEHIIEHKKKFPTNSLLLTFDDGYKDNFYSALPILELFSKQALFFVSTSNIDSQDEFWWNKIQNLVFNSSDSFECLPSILKVNINDDSSDKYLCYSNIFQFLAAIPYKERQDIISEWASNANCKKSRSNFVVMDWSELKLFNKSKSVTIGAHTHGHSKLSSLIPVEQRKEIATSITLLEENLNIKINHFAFPFGTPSDFNKDTLEICNELEVKFKYAVQKKVVYGKKVHQYFPRFFVHDWDTKIFEEKIKLFYKYY